MPPRTQTLSPRDREEVLSRVRSRVLADSGQDVPTIDLGDDAEFVIPRAPAQPAFRDVRIPTMFGQSSSVRLPTSAPSPVQAASFAGPSPVPSRPGGGAEPLPERSELNATSRLVDDSPQPELVLQERRYPDSAEPEADQQPEDMHPPGTNVILSASEGAFESLTPSPVSVSREGRGRTTPEQKIPGIDAKAARVGSPDDFVQRMTPEEKARLDRAETQDRRRRIAGGIMTGIGALTGIIGAARNNPAAAGIGMGLIGSTQAMLPNRRELVQGHINDRVAADQAGLDARRAQEQRAIEQQNAAEDRALRNRAAEADIGLTEARIGTEQAQQAEAEFERQAMTGNAEGMRNAIRARAEAIIDPTTRSAWLRRLRNGGELDSMTDLASLQRILAEVADTDVRRGSSAGRGGAGGGRSSRIDPETGLTVAGGGGGGSAPREMLPLSGESAPAPVSGAAPASSGGRPVRGARPLQAPAASPETPSDLPADEVRRRAEFAAMRLAVPDLTDREFGIAAASMRRHGLTPEDMQTAAGQATIRADVDAYREAPAAERARQQREAAGTFARAAGGAVPRPETVTDQDWNYLGPKLDTAYQEGVAPFRTARRALADARRAGLSEAQIRIALAGSRGESFFSGLNTQQSQAAQTLMQLATHMRESYARRRSGAAIGPNEWEQFNRILGDDSILRSSQAFDQAMLSLIEVGRGAMHGIAGTRTSPADDVMGYWQAQRESARGRGR